MIVAKNFEIKPLVVCVPGELVVVVVNTGNALAILLQREADEVTLGMLGHGDSAPPSYLVWKFVNAKCLSYGSEWIFQPELGPESNFRDRTLVNSAGAIHVDNGQIVMNFAAYQNDSSFDERSYDLQTLQDVSIQPGAIPFAAWNIWANQAEYDGDYEPLFSFTATPK